MNYFKQLNRTYQQLRLIAGCTLIVAPLLILAAGYWHEIPIKPTLSHYYFVEKNPGLIRTLFTGFLIFVGGILVAYRGFDIIDNWIHNAAGLFAVCVALFPMICDDGEPYCVSGLLSSLHKPSAFLVFVFAILAVIYCGGPDLKDNLNDEEKRTLWLAMWASLITMIAAIVLYVARIFLSARIQKFTVTILIVELLGFFGFAAHWLVMTSVIKKANLRKIKKHELPKPSAGAIDPTLDSGTQRPPQPIAAEATAKDLLLIP